MRALPGRRTVKVLPGRAVMILAERHHYRPVKPGSKVHAASRARGTGVRLGPGAAAAGMVAAQVAGAAVFFMVLVLSGSGLLDLAAMLGATAAFVGCWWLRSTHPYQALLLGWI